MGAGGAHVSVPYPALSGAVHRALLLLRRVSRMVLCATVALHEPGAEDRERVYDKLFDLYVKGGILGQGAIILSFTVDEDWEHNTYRVTEIFRNADAAEAYYDFFLSKGVPCLVCLVFSNLNPALGRFARQVKGPEAVVSDGNVKAYGNVESMRLAPQLVKFNHLKIEGSPNGIVEIEDWLQPPTIAQLEARFGRLHFGLRSRPSLLPTEGEHGDAAPAAAPPPGNLEMARAGA